MSDDGLRSGVIRLADVQARIPGPAGENATVALKRGTLDVTFSRPKVPNVQAPHEQDELYVIVRGHGVLFHDGRRDPFESGDLLFVAAGVPHHFEDTSEDLRLWRVFYGRAGGEVPS